MARDIRDILKEDSSEPKFPLRDGHKARFEALLDEKLPQKEESSEGGLFLWMKIAAVIMVAVIAGWAVYGYAFAKADSEKELVENTRTEKTQNVRLADISPEFKKLEDYYVASVNVELARLEFDDANKELVDAFMKQLASLDREYKKLNAEITETGLTSETVDAMVQNLKLRLELLFKLKSKLNELKQAPKETAVKTA